MSAESRSGLLYSVFPPVVQECEGRVYGVFTASDGRVLPYLIDRSDHYNPTSYQEVQEYGRRGDLDIESPDVEEHAIPYLMFNVDPLSLLGEYVIDPDNKEFKTNPTPTAGSMNWRPPLQEGEECNSNYYL